MLSTQICESPSSAEGHVTALDFGSQEPPSGAGISASPSTS